MDSTIIYSAPVVKRADPTRVNVKIIGCHVARASAVS